MSYKLITEVEAGRVDIDDFNKKVALPALAEMKELKRIWEEHQKKKK